MTDGLKRKPNGQFPKNRSGNPDGRPKNSRRRRLERPSDFRQAILDMANQKVTVRQRDGSEVKTTLFEAQLMNLVSPQPKSRLGAKNFIEIVQHAAAIAEQLSNRQRGAGEG